MRLSELQHKEVVNIIDGKKMGHIIDTVLDEEGKLECLVVEKHKFIISWFSTHNEIQVKWTQIEKIGDDVILVKIII